MTLILYAERRPVRELELKRKNIVCTNCVWKRENDKGPGFGVVLEPKTGVSGDVKPGAQVMPAHKSCIWICHSKMSVHAFHLLGSNARCVSPSDRHQVKQRNLQMSNIWIDISLTHILKTLSRQKGVRDENMVFREILYAMVGSNQCQLVDPQHVKTFSCHAGQVLEALRLPVAKQTTNVIIASKNLRRDAIEIETMLPQRTYFWKWNARAAPWNRWSISSCCCVNLPGTTYNPAIYGMTIGLTSTWQKCYFTAPFAEWIFTSPTSKSKRIWQNRYFTTFVVERSVTWQSFRWHVVILLDALHVQIMCTAEVFDRNLI